MEIKSQNNHIIYKEGRLIFNHRCLFQETDTMSFLYLGKGTAKIKMYRGNFKIVDKVSERLPLHVMTVHQLSENCFCLDMAYSDRVLLKLNVAIQKGRLLITLTTFNHSWNRCWLRLVADPEEKIYGCGEQMSDFNLRGRHYPLWTSEPGIGRNKRTLTTFYADQKDQAGGDYYTTNFPQPTFISTRKYYCHTASFQYADFDFRPLHYHELGYWGIPNQLIFETGRTYKELVGKLTALLGRQPELPDWLNNGAIIGLQGGIQRTNRLFTRLRKHGVKIAALWCQDWEGTQTTSFGKRNYWEWKYSAKLYPNLPKQIKNWEKAGVKFLSYINPYLINTSRMFNEAEQRGYLAKKRNGTTYLVDFGEFECGIVDFTNPPATEWFKKIIKNNLIKIGCKGWMADFGEYLPTDVVLADHADPLRAHNAWPVLWAKCNYDAVVESNQLNKTVYFMRAGGAGSQHYCPLLWAGDQSVNWSLDDGLASTIPAALSVGMSGCGLTHSDIGGYTSQYGNFRSKELFMRWAEMATFLPVMRTHEGNRPNENFQVYDDEEAMESFARCTKIYVDLTKYRQALVQTNHERGIPVQRPLFMEFEKDHHAYDIKYEYLFGPDVLVAPVYRKKQSKWQVYLPQADWVGIWDGKHYPGGTIIVPAPLGFTPVFYRADSPYQKLFSRITAKYGLNS